MLKIPSVGPKVEKQPVFMDTIAATINNPTILIRVIILFARESVRAVPPMRWFSDSSIELSCAKLADIHDDSAKSGCQAQICYHLR